MGERHNEHHFVPAFLLRQWEAGEDGKLTTMCWRNGSIKVGRNKAKAVAKLYQLYTLQSAPPDAKNIIEAKIFQRVDDEGAAAHAEILRGSISDLGPKLVSNWTRFVVSLLARSPWFIKQHIDQAPAIIEDVIRKTAEDGEDVAKTLQAVMSADPHLATSITLRAMVKMLPKSSSHEALQGSRWMVADVDNSPVDFVMGDRPVLRADAQGFARDFLLALPIAPKKLFIAHRVESAWPGRLAQLSARDLVMRANRDMAAQAMQYLFTTSTKHFELARRYLRQQSAT